MNKRIFAIILAGLLLLSATACNPNDNGDGTTADSTKSPVVDGTSAPTYTTETDADGNIITVLEESTKAPNGSTSTETDNVSEENPTWKDIDTTVYVATESNLRSNTVVEDSSKVSEVEAGTTLTATGESDNWYRVTYNEKTLYIAKSVAIDKATLDSFTAIDDEVIVTAEESLYVRLLPNKLSKAVGVVYKNDKLTRVAVGEKWSRIVYGEGEDAKEYYVSNSYIKSTTPATETTATADTVATTEAASEEA